MRMRMMMRMTMTMTTRTKEAMVMENKGREVTRKRIGEEDYIFYFMIILYILVMRTMRIFRRMTIATRGLLGDRCESVDIPCYH